MNRYTAIMLLAVAGLTYASAQNNAPQGWTLRQCIDYAIEHNISIRQSANTVEQNKVEVNTDRWARLPDLNGSADQSWSWGRAASPVNNSYTDMNSANTRFSVGTNIPLFTGFRIPNRYELSKLNLKASIEDLKKAKEDISINVTALYLQALLNLELSKVAYHQIELSKEQLNRIKGWFDVGKASTSQVAEAQARVAQDEMNAVQADNNYNLAVLDLTQLLELPTPEGFTLAGSDEDLTFSPLTPPDEIYTQAITYKPGIKAAEYRLQGSEKSIRLAQSQYYPQLSFNAGLGTNYYSIAGQQYDNFGTQMKNNFNKYLGFTLNIPIFNRLSTRNKVKTARLQQANLALELENAKKSLYKEIQQAWYNAVAAESKYNSSISAVEANEESFRLMSEKFNNGKANYVEYTEAKLSLTKALSDKLQAQYDYIFRTKILDFYKGQPIE